MAFSGVAARPVWLLVDLVGAVFAPGRTLRRVARRQGLVASVAAVLLLSVGLVLLGRGRLEAEVPLVPSWLRVAAVVLAAWLFLAHLLWRAGGLLGGRGSFRSVAAATATAFTAGGGLAALVADGTPRWLAVPLLLWAWWVVGAAVRWSLRLTLMRAVGATLAVSIFVWACYLTGLPWRLERVGVDHLLAMWAVEAPAQYLLLPNLWILGALVLLAAAALLASLARPCWCIWPALAVGGAAAAAAVLGAWFVRYLDGFLHSPLNQPHAVALAEDGGLLVRGVGGAVRLTAGETFAWHRPEAADGLLPGPDGVSYLVLGGEEEVLVVKADGRVARRVALPRDLPVGWVLRMGEAAYDGRGHLYFLAGRPALLHRLTLSAGAASDEIVDLVQHLPGEALDRPLSAALGDRGDLYLAARGSEGRYRLLRLAVSGGPLQLVHEESVEAGETWRLVAGLDGAMYVGSTRSRDGRVTRWEVRRLSPEGGRLPGFVRTDNDRDGVGTVNPSFAVDAAGTVYVADREKFRVAVFDGDGRFIRTLPPDRWYRRLAIWLLQRTRPRAAAPAGEIRFSA